jgi:hypothetical protein
LPPWVLLVAVRTRVIIAAVGVVVAAGLQFSLGIERGGVYYRSVIKLKNVASRQDQDSPADTLNVAFASGPCR